MAHDDKAAFRQATFDDREQATALLHGFGMGHTADPAHVRRWWDWIWERNPALHMGRPRPPIGWVLEDGKRLVGFFGNIPARYALGEDPLLVAVASHWAVLKPHRGQTAELSTAYFAQTEADLLMVTTGIVPTGRIFTRFGASPMPVADYRTVLYWVLDAAGFMGAALRRKNVEPRFASAFSRVGGPLVRGGLALARHGPRMPASTREPDVIAPTDVGDEFDCLWQRKQAEGRRLLASRRSEDIRWHFELEPPGRVRILCARREGRLDGYLVLMQESVSGIGLSRAKIVDLLVAADDPQVTSTLLRSAHALSREMGCHVLELVGFPASVRSLASALRPLTRQFDVHPWHFKAQTPELDAILHMPEAWYPTLYDGDSCLTPL